jgi:hypothetical protein
MVILGFVAKGRPWVYLQPEVHGPSVVVHNMAREPIVVRSIDCGRVSLLVARSHDVRDTEPARAGEPLNVSIGVGAVHSFSLLTTRGWEVLSSRDRVVVSLHWSLSRLPWLPQLPKRLSVSVSTVSAVMRLAPVIEMPDHRTNK